MREGLVRVNIQQKSKQPCGIEKPRPACGTHLFPSSKNEAVKNKDKFTSGSSDTMHVFLPSSWFSLTFLFLIFMVPN